MMEDLALMRSNYFAVRDLQAFQTFCQACGVELLAHIHDGLTLYGIATRGFIPSTRYDLDSGTHEDINFLTELSQYLEYGWVAILLEVGTAENGRFPIGNAWAVNAQGETRHMGLADIFELAAPLGQHVIDVFGFGETTPEA